jgi:hypothetical protein
MRIRLIRRVGRWAPTTVMTVTTEMGSELISEKKAEEYKGVYPPKKGKNKLNLSQLKA